jgi:UPF0755 protein
MRKICFFLAVLVACFVAAVFWLYSEFSSFSVNPTNTAIIFIVPKHATIADVATLLEEKGASQNTHYFLWLGKLLGQLKPIKAGEYSLPTNTTPKLLIQKLSKGQVLLHKITFPEGWTFQQFLAALAAEPKLAHTVKDQNNAEIMAAIGHAGEHPEGLFYPDTYFFTLGSKDVQILRLAYDLMQKKLQQAWLNRADDLPYRSSYEALIVASLIEKESAIVSERPMIAGVILHRLKIAMRLQIDAAVLYGLADKNRRVLRYSDLSADTTYNTYTRNGLPPTPISMPSSSAIFAVLHPTTTQALYYVAKGDGSHTFSETLAAHRVAVQAYRKYNAATDAADYLKPYQSAATESVQQCFSGALVLNSLQRFP